MNKRKMIYKGFNKRRKTNYSKIFILLFILVLGVFLVKDNIKFNILDEIKSISDNINVESSKIKEFDYNDIKDELNNKNDIDKEETKEKTEETMVASIDEWTFYTVQVASMKEDIEVEKLTQNLSKSKIPYSILESDGVKKVQTYTSFNKESIRKNLDEVRKSYPDAFLSEVNMPMISLEYTEKYKYISEITNSLNDLIKNFEEETLFWNNTNDSINMEHYNQILVNRKSSIDKIKLEAEKIDYEGMKEFKENLLKYTNDVYDNIELSSKSANEQNENISKGLLLDSMQGYCEFIDSIS